MRQADGEFALEATGLACLKGERMLFRGLGMQVARGQMLRLAGTNGIGKTSLLRILAGLAVPEEGAVCWHGRSISEHPEAFQRDSLYLGHALALNEGLTPLENLRFAAACAGDSSAVSHCADALARLGMAGQMHLPVSVLSQGQRRRAALARLPLSHARSLWMLDEPFAALDADAIAIVAEMLHAHCAKGGLVVMITHQDAVDAQAVAVLDVGAWVC
ncbi:MAG TPA: cytochrome c biogenesis heme-transporting ATPase CcmA [Candidimonas sp.]|nr:cytochrome c biogenesis heme-transporting ATPase CcmA [Candidimonas sp.]